MIIFENALDYINNHVVASIIAFTVIVYTTFLLIKYIFSILNCSKLLIEEKIYKYKINRTDHLDMVTLTMPERVNLTTSMFEFISNLITEEVESLMKTYVSLNTPYEIIKLDNDVEKISKIVYAGLNTDVFTDPNLIITKEYMMSFITKKTSYILLNYVLIYNNDIKESNKVNNDDTE